MDQSEVAYYLFKSDPSLTYTNDNGNPAINRDILKEFKKLHQGMAKWDRSCRGWDLVKP